MPRVLWCNLDPGWPFARMLRDHCLDWIRREDIWIWDLVTVPGESDPPWDAWPARVTADGLLDALDELPATPPDGRLLMLHLPDHAADSDDGLGLLIQGIAGRVEQNDNWTMVLSLPERAELGRFRKDPYGARLIARLSNEPRQRIRTQRMLTELMLDPDLAWHQLRPDRPMLVEVMLQADGAEPPHDQVAALWFGQFANLLTQIHTLEHAVPADVATAEQANSDEAAPHGADARTDRVEELIEDAGGLRNKLKGFVQDRDPRDPQNWLPSAPRFFDPRFPAKLDMARTRFLGWVDDELSQRWTALLAERSSLEDDQRRANSLVDPMLPSAWVLGYGAHGHDRLEGWRRRLADEIEKTSTGNDALVLALSRDLRLPGDPGSRGYVRHRFTADDDFDEAVESAKQVAPSLVRLVNLVLGWLLLTLLACVPILAMRMPSWLGQSGGLTDYLGRPDRWSFDLAWILLPGLLYLGAGLVSAVRRRAALVQGLAKVTKASDRLWQRHFGVLECYCDLLGHAAAMRRLMRLDGHLRRLADAQRRGRGFLVSLRGELERQQRDYPSLGVKGEPSNRNPDLSAAMRQDGGPLRWLAELAPSLPDSPSGEVRIKDERLQPGILRTDYLIDHSTLDLKEVSE